MFSAQHTAFVVCGPTAVGKTAVAIALARALGTEIINADSRQVYAELNIGVARPSEQELAAVKHHLVGTHAVTQLYGAGDFEAEALSVSADIFSRHSTLVLCGGTGMYIKAYCEGLDALPTADESYRVFLKEILNEKGLVYLQELLRQKDPQAFGRLDVQNPQRLMRALEVIQVTGKPYSAHLTGTKVQRPFRIIKTGLHMDREQLYARINQRVQEMMQAGLLEEVRGLLPYRHHNALKTVGYKELFAFLDGAYSLEKAVGLIQQHTRNYAKRQLTWFRADSEIHWFEPQQTAEIINFARSV